MRLSLTALSTVIIGGGLVRLAVIPNFVFLLPNVILLHFHRFVHVVVASCAPCLVLHGILLNEVLLCPQDKH